ncbi:MAG: hypothetical protein V1861_04490 [Candidatus Micrarchaeota archaeon]
MTRALICPRCRTIIPGAFYPPKAKLAMAATCPKCGDVEAMIVELGRETRGGKWAKDVEPTELEDQETELISSIIPGGGALFSIGNSLKVARFIGLRLLVFCSAYLLFRDSGALNLQNPYVLVLGSSLFLLLSHLAYLISGRLNLRSFIKEYDATAGFFLVLTALMVLGPLLVFEVLLIAFSPLYFLLDAAIAALSFFLWREEAGSKKD